MMKAISLFSGAGGMDIGFQRVGFDVVAASEIDARACETFRANHSSTHLFEGDLRVHMDAIAAIKDVDVVFGGPPCQGFSVAGKMDATDPRSQLVFSFADIVQRLRPKAFVMENVKALGTLSKFAGVRGQLISRFQKAGYAVQLHILNAKDFGVPQSRERTFFIGVQADRYQNLELAFKRRQEKAPTLREAIIPLGRPGSPKNSQICKAKITLAKKPVLRRSPYAGMLFNGQGRPLNPDGWASTLPATMGGNRTPIVDEQHLYDQKASWIEDYHRYLIEGGKPNKNIVIPSYIRRLTINEVALLQGFPQNYTFYGSNSRIYSQIGNAVPCKLAEKVANVVASVLSGEVEAEPCRDMPNESLQLSFC